MSRTIIELPNDFHFETTLDIYINHINLAKHLGNDSLVSLLNEARCRYLSALGAEQMAICGVHLINADLAVILKSEAKYGDQLRLQIQATEFQKYGCDFVYRVSNSATGHLVAIAKTTMLCFDYQHSKLCLAPNGFVEFFNQYRGSETSVTR